MASPRDNSSTIGMSTLSTFLSPLTVWIKCRSLGTLLAGAVLSKWPPPSLRVRAHPPALLPSAARSPMEPCRAPLMLQQPPLHFLQGGGGRRQGSAGGRIQPARS